MKKFLIGLAIFVAVVILAAAILPVFFKDDVKAQIDKALDEHLNAKVYYDVDHFGLSLFKHFPNPTVSLEDFGVVGKEPFEKDTLFAASSFDLTIDLFSLFGDKPTVKSLNLNRAKINIIVLEDGTANYDIAVESSDTVEEDTTAGESIKIGIDKWTLTDSEIIYDDRSLPYYLALKKVNHEGTGDFTLSVFDMVTHTDIGSIETAYDGVTYLSGQQVTADVTLNMDIEHMKYTFKDNKIMLNDFPLTFNGYLAMPEEDIDMDISFGSENASIKSLYSLVPGVFTEGYDNINAEGTLSFSGYVKGTYNEQSIPGYNVSLQASNGMIQYPDLPTPISNINMNMLVDCPDGIIDQTLIDIKKFHLDFGNNPVDAKILIKNLVDYDMDANVKAHLNLGELSTMFPMEGLDMKGLFDVELTAAGVYDSVRQIIPRLSGAMSMRDGYIKYTDLPKSLENLNFTSTLACNTGAMKDFILKVNDFNVKMGEDRFNAMLIFQNLDDYTWDLSANGTIDLAVINDYAPVEGMSYKGKLVADINTKGKYSDVQAERYGNLPTSGNAGLTDFVYSGTDLANDFIIDNAQISFDPEQIQIKSLKAKSGSSDFDVKGYLSDYLDYALTDDDQAMLKGEMSLTSNRIDVNEFMTGEETTETTEDTVAMEVIQVPKNIDFVFQSNIASIYYDNLTLNNASGKIIVREGVVNLDQLGFNMLGGEVVMTGYYDSRDIEAPKFEYNLGIQQLSIPQSFQTFTTVQAFAPFAQQMQGDFSSDFKISGLLGEDMMPQLSSITGGGLIKIAEAAVKESKLVSGLNGLTKMNLASENLTLKDVVMSARINDGRAYVKPFDVKLGDNVANIKGSIGLDQSLNYQISTDIETGQAGQALNSFISNHIGKDITTTKAKVDFQVGGTYKDPKFTIASIDYGEGEVKNVAEKKVEEEVEQAKEEAKEKAEEKAEEVKKEAEKKVEEKAKKVEEKAKEKAKEELGEEGEKAVEKGKKVIKDLFN